MRIWQLSTDSTLQPRTPLDEDPLVLISRSGTWDTLYQVFLKGRMLFSSLDTLPLYICWVWYPFHCQSHPDLILDTDTDDHTRESWVIYRILIMRTTESETTMVLFSRCKAVTRGTRQWKKFFEFFFQKNRIFRKFLGKNSHILKLSGGVPVKPLKALRSIF